MSTKRFLVLDEITLYDRLEKTHSELDRNSLGIHPPIPVADHCLNFGPESLKDLCSPSGTVFIGNVQVNNMSAGWHTWKIHAGCTTVTHWCVTQTLQTKTHTAYSLQATLLPLPEPRKQQRPKKPWLVWCSVFTGLMTLGLFSWPMVCGWIDFGRCVTQCLLD